MPIENKETLLQIFREKQESLISNQLLETLPTIVMSFGKFVNPSFRKTARLVIRFCLFVMTLF